MYVKVYKSEHRGKPMSNLWNDIHSITRTNKDPRLYPTQKPQKLIARIVKMLSNEKFIIPEYKIDLLNKSKKSINSIENIDSIAKIKIVKKKVKEVKNKETEKVKNKIKKNKLKKKIKKQ